MRLIAAVAARAGARRLFELRDGIAPLIAELSERGFQLGMVANQPDLVWLAPIETTGLLQFFRYHGASGLVGLRKPDPRLFLAASAALGAARRLSDGRVTAASNTTSRRHGRSECRRYGCVPGGTPTSSSVAGRRCRVARRPMVLGWPGASTP